MKKSLVFVFGLVLSVAVLAAATTVSAAQADSKYVYDFRNATGVIANQAAANPGSALTLVGDWTSDENGTNFTGNTTDTQSTSYAKPASGPTINVSTTTSVGAAVIFTQDGTCGTDSENITQIGKFAANAAQVKLQLSKCVSKKLYPECRIAGALTASSVVAVRGTQVISAGTPYRLECVKGADNGTSTPLVMKTTDLTTNITTTNTFNIKATGLISTTAYLSAGGKWPAATQSNNTDQYTGSITKLGYCVSADVASAQACLAAEVAL